MTSKIKITFLGTADQIPSRNRNHTAILLTYNDENILVDCGEGTQRQFRKAELNPCKITKLLITHWHGDHVLGIPGLLQTLASSGYNKTLEIYGPRGIKQRLEQTFELFGSKKELQIEIHEISEGVFIDEEEFFIQSAKTFHGLPGLAYSFVKKGLVRIDKDKMKKMKVPQGKHLQDLKEMRDITIDGKKYKWKDLTFKEENKKITIILDTLYDKSFEKFAKDSDILICESNFSSEIGEKAEEHLHLTSQQAAEIAKKSDSKKLILTHLSQRYEYNLKEIQKEAQEIFKNTFVAKDLDVVEI
ncbi:ribonuclease Z [Candidatus Pacearchaeota archaeon]|nr:ribonuclease Z [Candidatus Pacearchaeota archaeon]